MEKQIQAAIAVGSHREALTLIARAHSTPLLRFCYGLVRAFDEITHSQEIPVCVMEQVRRHETFDLLYKLRHVCKSCNSSRTAQRFNKMFPAK